MPKKLYLIVAFLFLNFSLTVHNQAAVDMTSEKISTRLADTAKINSLIEKSRHYRHHDAEKSLLFAKKALHLSQSSAYAQGCMRSLNRMGLACLTLQRLDSALAYHQQALAIATQIKDTGEQVNSLNNIGLIYLVQVKYREALNHFSRALQLGTKTGKSLAPVLLNMGLLMHDQMNYAEALAYFSKAEKAALQADDRVNRMRVLWSAGNTYINIRGYDTALAYLNKALLLKKQLPDESAIGILFGLGRVYYNKGDFKHALHYYTQAYQTSVKTKSAIGQCNNLIGIGDNYMELKRYREAYQAYTKALATNPSDDLRSNAQIGLSNAYRELGKYKKALAYARKGLALAVKIHQKFLIREAYWSFSQAYAASGKHTLAYQYLLKHNALKDSIFSTKTNSYLTSVITENRHRLEKQQLQNKLLAQTNKLQQAELENKNQWITLLYISIGALILVTIIASYAIYIKRKSNKALEAKNCEITRISDELRDAQQKLQSALSLGEVGTWRYCAKSCNIFLDENASRIFGIPVNSEGITPEDFTSMILPEYRALEQEMRDSAILHNTEYQVEYRVKHEDGKTNWVLSRGKAKYYEDGKLESISGVMVDITDKKESERHKDEFLSITSHELKTPLTSIKGYLHLAKNTLEPEHGASLFVSKSIKQLIRLERLISDLMDATRVTKGKLYYAITEFDFGKMMKEIVESMQLTVTTHQIMIKKTISLNYIGDRYRIEQVINNFLNNAIKYSPNADKVEVRLKKDKDTIVVAIKDFGIGIESGHQQRLHERFYRVSHGMRKFEGLGLGLYISSEILKHHGGHFWVESELGKGSVFYFSLPLVHSHQNMAYSNENKKGVDVKENQN